MNVLVLAANGLHCHWLGPYGNEWVSTPAFDALAVEAVVFDQHYADDPSPAGSARTSAPGLLQALRAGRVTTALVDDRKDRPPDSREWDLVVRTNPASHPTPGDALITAVESALDQLSSHSPWLLWIETDRLVPPWDFDAETYQHYASATARFGDDEESSADLPAAITNPITNRLAADDDLGWHRLHNSFAAALTSFDAELDVLIEVWRERQLDRTAAWVLTSGHGWPLGEHGVVGPHGSRMHTELVHLPLLIRFPEHREGMRRVSAFTQSPDLAPTLADLFGIGQTIAWQGRSLMPLTSGSSTQIRDLVRSSSARASHIERGLRTPDWTFLPAAPQTGAPQRLYRRPDDIWEVNDLAPRHPDECDRLAALLDNPTTNTPEPSP
jgi:arylsulfatase A-like enzyme